MGMNLQVSGQLVDTLGQDSDLDLGGTGVGLVGAVSFDNCGLFVLTNPGSDPPFKIFPSD